MGFVDRVKRFRLAWWIKLDWRSSNILPILFVIELPFTIAGLALFGIADPDTYRTKLWREGSRLGWNSNPKDIVYSYANYKPVAAPKPWNQFTTDWNVVVAVLALFIYLVKCVMYISHVFPPFISALVHAFVLSIWLVAIVQQAGPDYLDPEYPAQFPFYLTKGCGAPVSPNVQGACKMTQAAFAVTCLMSALFLTYTIVSIIFAIPSATQKAEAITIAEEEAALESDSPIVTYYDDKRFEYEMDQFNGQKSPAFAHVPVTPRTQAFNTLEGRKLGASVRLGSPTVKIGSPPGSPHNNRDLPLRHHISMGTETYEKTRFA